MSMIRIEREALPRYQARLSELEHLASYPLGDDRFKIDHGPDYFRFFERLGKLYFYANVDHEQLVAVGAGILRRVSFRDGQAARKCWYAADVKVHPDHRGKHVPLSSASRLFLPNFFRCRRGYAITMNPGDGNPNRVVGIAQKFKWVTIQVSGVLELFSLDAQAMRATEPLLREQRGPLSYLSLRGIKDIVLESTGQPMPLLHVQFGSCAEAGQPAPAPDHTHMFCALHGNPLAQAMSARGIKPSATATIVSHGMNDADWRFVLTSDI